MNDVTSLIVTAVALVVSIFSSYVAWSASRTSTAASRAAYSVNFFAANQAALEHPELLIDVHGLDATTDVREARALVYLNLLLDGFAVANSRIYRGDFTKMTQVMKQQGDSLRRFLAIPANAARWELLKKRSYGDFDADFIEAVDKLIAFEADLALRPGSAP